MAPSATIADRGSRATSPLTRDKVIERLRRWAALYGAPPTTADWNPSVARWRAQEWRAERYRLGDPETGEAWPSTTAAKRRFDGSFDAALRAAGFEPHRSGPRGGAEREARGAGSSGGVPAGGTGRSSRATDGSGAAERALRAQIARAERAEARTAESRARARVAGDRARRAVAAKERARAELSAERRAAAVRERAAGFEAEARLQAAEDRAAAATRDAQRARGLASASVREAAQLRDALRGALTRAEDAEDVARGALELTRPPESAPSRARLSPTDLEELRAAGGPGGPAVLADALRALGTARQTNDPVRLAAALADVAAAAVGWRDRL